MNDFDVWLSSKGFDPATLDEKQKQNMQAIWRSEGNGGGGTATAAVPPPPAKGTGSTFTQTAAAIAAESERVSTIERLGEEAMKQFAKVGNTVKVEQVRTLTESAATDEAVSVRDFKYELIQLGRADAVSTVSRATEPEAGSRVVEAAVCRRAGMEGLEKFFTAQELEASEKHYRRGLSLVGLLADSARRHGWRSQADVESKDFLRAAFGQQGGDGGPLDMRAAVTGPSTYSLPNVLGNIANKYLRLGFDNYDSAWSAVSARRSVNDFKTITTATLTGGMMFKKLAPSGEIKHGDLGEVAYTNKADTYAIMLGIERPDLINDDTGALTSAARRIGRGAALKINDVFWTVFLNNSAFFTAGNNNVITGGTSVLSGAALKLADQKFRVQTDPNGFPLGAMPRILLVPPTLWYTSRELMNSSLLVGTPASNALAPATNIFQGSYQIVTSPYMENTSYTGNSTTAYYLLADPNDVPVIEGVFLNGKDTPTVETADADFNHLGIAMRGYIDFGFGLQEFRGGVRAAGA